jgi:hypothetical protein
LPVAWSTAVIDAQRSQQVKGSVYWVKSIEGPISVASMPNRPWFRNPLFVVPFAVTIALANIDEFRWRYIKWPDITSRKIRLVAFRSRCIMIILDRLFICEFESNSVYSILHINETKPTRNGRRALWSSVVWLFEIPKCDGEKRCDYVFGYGDTLCAYRPW